MDSGQLCQSALFDAFGFEKVLNASACKCCLIAVSVTYFGETSNFRLESLTMNVRKLMSKSMRLRFLDSRQITVDGR
jgi:hypothetical protein